MAALYSTPPRQQFIQCERCCRALYSTLASRLTLRAVDFITQDEPSANIARMFGIDHEGGGQVLRKEVEGLQQVVCWPRRQSPPTTIYKLHVRR